MAERIGFVGLGIMGKPMAKNLVNAGNDVTVFNRSSASVEELVAEGANAGSSAADVASKSDIALLMVPDSPDSETVVLGENGLLEGASAGDLIVDMSSIEPGVSQKIHAACSEKGINFLDAPVSGGEPMAISGDLAIMVGGSAEDFERAKPLFDVMGKSAVLCGDSGAGNTTKLANQIIVGANIHALAEALVLATKAGVNPETVFNAINGGLAGSNVMNAKAPMMFERNFAPGFRIELHYKDINNAAKTANELDLPLQVTANLQQVFKALVGWGEGGNDHSGILSYVEKLSGVTVTNN
ncbi:MAG TPA: 2-hydroxy-3-oxopropionate reductase [Dehalococcoidia bacterium]|nr:2-hydroxy-3-oxopropionate reductase [Chloroflexota bacterium]HCI86608.1 2-hydroxy-3-oxopropionate reductase [Dehalococcoidia bacterium]|tara:strand:- start:112 stop:1005 length:894 start_codon:yes stop_codon:yes gene_type:complete